MHSKKTSILIQGLKLRCHVGVPASERVRWQIVDVDVRCELEDKDMHRDDITVTVSYADIVAELRRLSKEREFVLLETMTCEIAKICFQYSLVKHVHVCVRKPNKLAGCDAVGVERVFVR